MKVGEDDGGNEGMGALRIMVAKINVLAISSRSAHGCGCGFNPWACRVALMIIKIIIISVIMHDIKRRNSRSFVF